MTDKSLIARRDELIEQILEVLRPQTDAAALAGCSFSPRQHCELQAAIAHYNEDVLHSHARNGQEGALCKG